MQDLQLVILNTFSSQSEEVRSAASYALGGWMHLPLIITHHTDTHTHTQHPHTHTGSVSAGNLELYLPFILSEIQGNPKRQYLLLHSLKEVISCHYGTPEAVATLRPQVPRIW